MGVTGFFKSQLKYGFFTAIKQTFKRAIDKVTGAEKTQDQLNTLFYFLNKYADVTTVPPAEGHLRQLQLCDVELMRILHAACEKNNLTYWIDYGTLLGGVRHKGFIPWDDDTDVSMPREDYERAVPILRKELDRFNISVEEKFPMWRIGMSYRHHETGTWIDIFPVDNCKMSGPIDDVSEALKGRILKYRKLYYRRRDKWSRDRLTEEKRRIIFNDGHYDISYHNAEFVYPVVVMHNSTDIYPLRQIPFENSDTQFFAPNNLDNYMRRIYGKNYMSFPRWGVEHHGSDEGTLSEWASQHGVDMEEVRKYLAGVADQIESEIGAVNK